MSFLDYYALFLQISERQPRSDGISTWSLLTTGPQARTGVSRDARLDARVPPNQLLEVVYLRADSHAVSIEHRHRHSLDYMVVVECEDWL